MSIMYDFSYTRQMSITKRGCPDGGNRVRFPGETGHYHFVPSWSPDGQWILYVDYRHDVDPEHHQADLCLARPHGTEQRFIT